MACTCGPPATCGFVLLNCIHPGIRHARVSSEPRARENAENSGQRDIPPVLCGCSTESRVCIPELPISLGVALAWIPLSGWCRIRTRRCHGNGQWILGSASRPPLGAFHNPAGVGGSNCGSWSLEFGLVGASGYFVGRFIRSESLRKPPPRASRPRQPPTVSMPLAPWQAGSLDLPQAARWHSLCSLGSLEWWECADVAPLPFSS